MAMPGGGGMGPMPPQQQSMMSPHQQMVAQQQQQVEFLYFYCIYQDKIVAIWDKLNTLYLMR